MRRLSLLFCVLGALGLGSRLMAVEPAQALDQPLEVSPSAAPAGTQITLTLRNFRFDPTAAAPSVRFEALDQDGNVLPGFGRPVPIIDVESSASNALQLLIQIPVDLSTQTGSNRWQVVVQPGSARYSAVMRVTNKYLAFFWAGLVLLLILGLGKLVSKSASPLNWIRGDNGRYSISLFQIGFWTCVVIFCVVYVWTLTYASIPLGSTILVLLGITSVSNLAAKNRNAQAAPAAAPASGAPEVRPDPKLTDLISDGKDRPCVSKLQMMIFTFIVGGMMIHSVLVDLKFLDLDPSYLALLGISNGVYLGDQYF